MKLIDLPTELHGNYVNSLSFCPDGRSLMYHSLYSIWFWQEEQFDRVIEYDWEGGYRKRIGFIRLSLCGQLIAVRFDWPDVPPHIDASFDPYASTLILIDRSSGNEVFREESEGDILDYCFAEGSHEAGVIEMIPGNDYIIRYRTLTKPSNIAEFWCVDLQWSRNVRRSRDGIILAIDEEFWRFSGFDNVRSILYDPEKGRGKGGFVKRIRNWLSTSSAVESTPLSIQADLKFNRPKGTTCYAVTPDGSCLLLGDVKGRVLQWHLDQRRIVNSWDWPIGEIRDLAVSPDGLIAAAAGGNGQLLLWDLD